MGTTTILYTDLVRSSELLSDIGDEAYAERFTNHTTLVRQRVESNGGVLVKLLGDGALATFDSAYAGVKAAVAVQQAVEFANREQGTIQLGLRVGLAVGEVVEVDDDVYGVTLVLARRLCDAASSGQILVSDIVRALIASRGDLEFNPIPPLALKGIAGPVSAWAVPWTALPDVIPLRVIVADDAPLIRSGIVRLLHDVGFVVVAEVADATELIEAVRVEPPDLVITDIRMPPTHTDEGLVAAASIRAEHPDVAVLVLSQHIEPERAASLLDGRPGGVGYLLKERVSDLDEFIEACRVVAAGGSVIDPIVGEVLIGRRRDDATISTLSGREREVLGLMAQGSSNQAIAAELFVSGKTVETYVRSIFQKLALVETPDGNRRVRAVLQWLKDDAVN